MAVPEFTRFFRPVLEVLADGQSKHWRDIEEAVAQRLELSEGDRSELVPSQRRTRLADRVLWALTHLRQARLVENPKRGISRITPRGCDYLARMPAGFTLSKLSEFEEYADFMRRSRSSTTSPTPASPEAALAEEQTQTPEERIATAFEEVNAALAQDILDRVKQMPPAFFEALIVKLMIRLGYGGTVDDAGKVIGGSGDGGVDGVINQDKLGLDKIYLQAKRWNDNAVGRQEVQAFVGALSGQGASRGVFMTTSSFSREAREYARHLANFKVSLVDGLELARLMIEYDLGVSLVQKYEVKRVDSDFFTEE